MKECIELKLTNVRTVCPHCGSEDNGWFGDPRGEKTSCDNCQKEYKVSKEAIIYW